MTERRLSSFHKRGSLRAFGLVLLISIIFSGISLNMVVAEEAGPVEMKTSVYRYTNIEPDKARELILALGLAENVSVIPNAKALTVLAPAEDFQKISVVANLIDTAMDYAIVVIDKPSSASAMDISNILGQDYDIGNFKMPPVKRDVSKVLIDKIDGKIVVVAPDDVIDMIAEEIEGAVATEAVEDEFVEALESADEILTTDVTSDVTSDITLEEDSEALDVLIVEEVESEPVIEDTDDLSGIEQELAETLVDEAIVLEIDDAETEISESVLDEAIDTVTEDISEQVEEDSEVDVKPQEVSSAKSLISNADMSIELNIDTLPSQVEIKDLLELIGKLLDINFIYNEIDVKGKVTLNLNNSSLTVGDVYSVLQSALKYSQLVMTRDGKFVRVAKAADAVDIDPNIITDGKVQPGDVVSTSIFKLKYIPVKSAEQMLKTMKLGINTIAIEETKTLIVTGYSDRMGRITSLLDIIDIPGVKRDFRFRELKYTLAENIVPKVETLAEQLGDVEITVSSQAGPAPTPTTTRDERGRLIRTPATAAGSSSSIATGQGKRGVFLDFDERTNRILMIGETEELETVMGLIDSFDVPQLDLRELKQYELEHIDATEAQDMLFELGVISQGSNKTGSSSRQRTVATPGGTARTTTATRTPAAATVAGSASGEDLMNKEAPQVVAMETRNTLFINANQEQHAQIKATLALLDQEPKEDAVPVQVYKLRNVSLQRGSDEGGSDIVETLNNIISKVVKDDQGKTQSRESKKEGLEIVEDKGTNSIVVYGPKKEQEWISKLIKELDIPRPQVLLEATLVEITKNDSFNLDLQMASKLPDMVSGEGMTILDPILDTFSSGSQKEWISKPNTVGGQAYYSDENIQVLLTAMEKKSYGRVLASPRVLVNDNQEGTITSKKTLYVARSSSTSTVSGDATLSTSVQFDDYTSGIELVITPTISEGEMLMLDIKLDRSNQDSPATATENTPPPDLTENTITTQVTVPDNSTIILGGINTLDQGKSNGKVPFLGDIPLIGALFRSTDSKDNQSKLYIFVKANISKIEDGVEGLPGLEEISRKEKAEFEVEEEKWQKYQGWPGVDSPAVDPLKVLGD